MRCTLINKPSAEICDACLTSRPEGIESCLEFILEKGGGFVFDAVFGTVKVYNCESI